MILFTVIALSAAFLKKYDSIIRTLKSVSVQKWLVMHVMAFQESLEDFLPNLTVLFVHIFI